MKDIMLRGLDTPQKSDVKEIIEEYLNRSTTSTKATTTAIETIIRQFRNNEKKHEEYSKLMFRKVKQLEAQNKELSQEVGLLKTKQDNFRSAFNEMLND